MVVNPEVRMLFDIKEVIYDYKWLSNTDNAELYYMYRGVSSNEKDMIKMNEYGLRYDITIIPPYMLGCEFVKTTGHYHQIVPGTDITFPEIYEVLSSSAYFLIQKPEGDSIKDVAMIKAEQGDKVIVPPGYGHITINTSNNILRVANWVAMKKESLYDYIKKKKGGAYYILQNRIIKNPMYSYIPDIRTIKPINKKPISNKIGMKNSDNMYELVNDIERLEFLIRPQEYERLFESILV